jgi:hypothetical protein
MRIEPGFIQNLIDPLIEWMCGRRRQIARGDPYRRLPQPLLTFSHRHALDFTTPVLL